ncbi:hypothetical protein BC939DRAFT_329714 [Gamsiella multidivaricata]|uniref:uncharacterized protein n=1 Tax=Gamsiella multidivaricata TaxID=101098 RepID=UPI0022209C3B|nr:uncharacterized protein BC939DRAFT_329714 [Gamsiella multidivaricata]KAI7817427.1 hypothetical protein BC939DRAFT_329714 [Gamsiella multidivaricata]
MFDSLAHPLLDTHRGEFPSFLKWRHPESPPVVKSPSPVMEGLDSPPPTPVLKHTVTIHESCHTGRVIAHRSTARPHVVLGRGDVGGIWADMDHDHNQTLSYYEHMELPLYPFSKFVHDYPEHSGGAENLERPLRSTVSAYYKAYVKHMGIQSNFSNYTTVTAVSLLESSADSPVSSSVVTSRPSILSSTLPIVIVGTGLSAADAILLIQEKQPWRQIIHIYKHYSASEPSPLKRCHRDVYPEYASIWVRMKKCATLKNSVQQYSTRKEGGGQHTNVFSREPCEQCEAMAMKEYDVAMDPQQQQQRHATMRTQDFTPLCSTCWYKGLPDASVSSWDPVTGEIVIILGHGVVIKERAAAVGVFIGKQVHMGFLKGSLAQEMLSAEEHGTSPAAGGTVAPGARRSSSDSRGRRSVRQRFEKDLLSDLMVDIPTPPRTPPRSPVLGPRVATTARPISWHMQVLQAAAQGLGLRCSARSSSPKPSHEDTIVNETRQGMNDREQHQEAQEEKGEYEDKEENEEEDNDESDDSGEVDPSQVLTLLHPLVSDMYNFRLIPRAVVASGGYDLSTSHSFASSSAVGAPVPAFLTKPKRCTRLPCYPIRQPSAMTATTADIIPISSASSSCDSEESDDIKTGTQVECLLMAGDKCTSTKGDHVGGTSKSSASGTMKSMAMSCISMPCTPLLGYKIISPEQAALPLLTLCSASLEPPSLSSAQNGGSGRNLEKCSVVKLSPPSADLGSCKQLESQAYATAEEEKEEEEEVRPLMDHSIYAAGAITGSKFVRYVLGNGVAIVADILKSEV